MTGKATAVSGANIALIKYWGRADHDLNLPLNSSISLTLDDLLTTTTVAFRDDLKADEVHINGAPATGRPHDRVARHLDAVRERAGDHRFAKVVSRNNFQTAAGLASSASAFSALTVAAFAALDADVDRREMSAVARLGSGSACRSLFGGFVEWDEGTDHGSSAARQLAPEDHWDLHDVALVVAAHEKKVKSHDGHSLAATSPLAEARLDYVAAALPRLREAIASRDLATLGDIAERDALAMHGVMMTSEPSLLYWAPGTMEVLHAVRRWRDEGLACYFTIDAGPNVHVLCEGADAPEVARRARDELGLAPEQVIDSGPGAGTRVVDDHLF